ncbi:small ribosomal subunit protein uS11m [Cloeon dipterum]|uniref:small ribosomal subunit protein uS11m n=1 Tax=Cloeon dipterum TaxID=197152 RepID=UPI00321FB63A
MLRQAILVPRIFSFLERSVLGSGERAGGLLAQETCKATCLLCGPQSSSIKRPLHTTVPRSKAEDRKEMLASMPKKDEGTEGEKTIDVDLLSKRFEDIFPDENTPSRLFDGIPYSQLNICDIKATKNNTIISLNDHKGKALMLRSCGMEGFKNTRQGTNIAAQATGISLAMRAIAKGFKDPVRVRVSGIGPGRMSAIKGLSMGGMNVVSITDSTRVSFAPTARARKQRRL